MTRSLGGSQILHELPMYIDEREVVDLLGRNGVQARSKSIARNGPRVMVRQERVAGGVVQ